MTTISQSSPEDGETLALIRRVLCPQAPLNAPLDQILPALTSSPSVDFQLYAFLAIVCRDFLFSWYSKITNDRVFIDEVIQVIAHTTRSLEQRLRQIDLETLLLDEIPSLLDNHVCDFRQAVYRHKTALCPHLSVPEIFHNLQPHPALKASPESERLYLKLLSSGVLAVILPTEDLHSDCERTLIREILSGLGFFNIADKLSEPFLLYEIITKVLTSLKPAETNTPPSPESAERVETPPVDLNTKEVLRKRKRNRREDGKASPKPPQSPSAAPPRTTPPSPNTKTIKDTCFEHAEVIANYLGRGIQILSTTISFVISVVQNPPPLPPPSPSARRRKPILRMSLLKFISNLLRINSKQPWLRGNILLALSSLSSRPTRSLVDNLLTTLIQKHITANPTLLTTILSLARTTLFPNNSPLGPARPFPTPAEQATIRHNAENALLAVIPNIFKKHYFGQSESEMREGVREYLDLMGKKEINKHLVYQVMDLVVLRLMPELAEEGPEALMGERGGGVRDSKEGNGDGDGD